MERRKKKENSLLSLPIPQAPGSSQRPEVALPSLPHRPSRLAQAACSENSSTLAMPWGADFGVQSWGEGIRRLGGLGIGPRRGDWT